MRMFRGTRSDVSMNIRILNYNSAHTPFSKVVASAHVSDVRGHTAEPVIARGIGTRLAVTQHASEPARQVLLLHVIIQVHRVRRVKLLSRRTYQVPRAPALKVHKRLAEEMMFHETGLRRCDAAICLGPFFGHGGAKRRPSHVCVVRLACKDDGITPVPSVHQADERACERLCRRQCGIGPCHVVHSPIPCACPSLCNLLLALRGRREPHCLHSNGVGLHGLQQAHPGQAAMQRPIVLRHQHKRGAGGLECQGQRPSETSSRRGENVPWLSHEHRFGHVLNHRDVVIVNRGVAGRAALCSKVEAELIGRNARSHGHSIKRYQDIKLWCIAAQALERDPRDLHKTPCLLLAPSA